jgi:2-methylisocitrate lyase-like PEP mutase family enzyme
MSELLASGQVLTVPGCYDAISAKLVERAGFPSTFMTGFGVAAVRGYPDTQLITYSEMRDSVQDICDSLKDTVLIADGDTGYGNSLNVKRTVTALFPTPRTAFSLVLTLHSHSRISPPPLLPPPLPPSRTSKPFTDTRLCKCRCCCNHD